MDQDRVYDRDICGWAEQQAAALRSLASRADLPNELDLLNVVEEIEDVGISQLRSVSSFMRLITSHLIMIAADADADSIGHWTREVAAFRGELIQSWQPSMRQRVNMDRIWRHAVEEATLKLSTYDRNGIAFDPNEITGRLGSASLVGVDDLTGESFKFHDLVGRLRARLVPEASL
ncbi:MAG: DUF29 family protein [Acetobacteraceae bacterium]|jgi:hypothetical protein